MNENKWNLFLLIPASVSFVILVLTQFIFIRVSFYSDRAYGMIGDDFQLGNYLRISADDFYLGSLKTTIVLSLAATAVTMLAAYPVGYILARMRSRWTTILLACVMLSSFVAMPIKILGLMVIFSQEGFLNQTLLSFRVISEPVSVVGNAAGVVLGYVHYTLGFAILLLYSVFLTIPRSYEEAAQVHGAGWARVFQRVVLPLSLPGIISMTLTIFNLNMAAFTAAVLLGGGRVLTLAVLIQRSIFLEHKYAMSAALAATLLILVVIVNIVILVLVSRLATPHRAHSGRQGRLVEILRGASTRLTRPVLRLRISPALLSPVLSGCRYGLGALSKAVRMIVFPLDFGKVRVSVAVLWLAAVYIFLLAPLVVVAGASLNGGPRRLPNLQFPPSRLSLDWYWEIPSSQLSALGVSVAVASSATFVACLLAIPAALGLVRSNVWGKSAIDAAFRVPLQIPTIVIGLAFFQTYYLLSDYIGINLIGTFFGLLIAHVFFIVPYVFGSTVAVVQRFDRRLEEAALSLGASSWRSLRRVILPIILPGIFSGASYGFIVSFSDVPVTVFLTGGNLITFPIEIFETMRTDFDGTLLASSTVVVVLSVGMLLITQRAVRLNVQLQGR